MIRKNILNNAIIRNSKTCEGYDNVAHETTFSIDRDNKGWDSIFDIGVYGISNGLAFFIVNGTNPALTRTNSFSIIDTSIYTEIVLKYKYINNRSFTATKGKIQFTTQSSGSFSEDNSVEFDIKSDEKWNTYRIDMSSVKGWVGNVNNLKIFFAIDGSPEDEIFLYSIKIQANKFSFCISDCFEDNSKVIIGDNFDLQTIGIEPQDYSLINIDNNRTCYVSIDPQNFNNKVVSLKNIGSISGPSIRKEFIGLMRGYFICRFYSTKNLGNIKLQNNLNSSILDIKIDSTGILKYKQALTYYNFDISHKVLDNNWNDLLINFNGENQTVDITLNGTLIGKNISYLLTGLITGIQVDNEVNSILYVDDVIIVDSQTTNLTCPGLGKQGSSTGSEVFFSKLDIIENINDSLIVNINDYGDEVIKLPQSIGNNLYEVRKILEQSISRVDFGGYPNVEVNYSDNKFTIKSGTYGFDSKVLIKKYKNSTLAYDLGFIDINDNKISLDSSGIPNSKSYKTDIKIKKTSKELLNLLEDENINTPILEYNQGESEIKIGSEEADRLGRKNTLIGIGATVIDFYHRATDEGLIKEIYFHGKLPSKVGVKLTGTKGYISGNIFITEYINIKDYNIITGDIVVINTPGYIGNGEYQVKVIGESGNFEILNGKLPTGMNLTYEIHNIPKIKQFRPLKNGSLTLINEVSVGIQGSGLYTRTADTHKVFVDWYVHRGDYIAIYNASEIYIGNDQTNVSESIYIKYDYDVIENIQLKPIEGYGIDSLGLLGTDALKKNKTIYDINLIDNISIDYIEIDITQESNSPIEYNLCTAVNNGLTVSSKVSGTHLHRVFHPGSALYDNISHPNISYNIQAITDGLKYASNGYLGTFETTISGAVYYYISGDGEYADVIYDSEGNIIDNSLEFPYYSNLSTIHEYIFDYQNDPYDLTFNFSVPVNINKFKIYFKEYPNADGYWLEYYNPHKVEYDGSYPGYQIIGKNDDIIYTKVSLNTLVLEQSFLENKEVLRRHFNKKFIGYLDTINPEDTLQYYALREYPYTVLEKEFSTVNTQSFNWHCNYHSSTKISEIELLNSISTESSIDSLVELYFSSDGDTFQRATNFSIENNKIKFKIAYPIRYIRLVVDVLGSVKLNKILGISTQDNIRFLDDIKETTITSIDVGARKEEYSSINRIKIKNLTGQTADLQLSIDTNELNKDILVKTTLQDKNSIDNPEIGPGGCILLDDNFDLPTINNVAINSDCYGLKNLAIGKKFYICEDSSSEHDLFINTIDINKWNIINTNFPSGNIGYFLGFKFPGFSIFPEPGPTGNPKDNKPVTSKLISKWIPLDSFSSSIECSYDSRQGKANSMSSAIGIVDGSGREIVICKNRFRCNPPGSSNNINYAEYLVKDSLLGTLATKRIFCIEGCSTPYGIEDDLYPYSLNITRVKDIGTNLLRFSYIDTINGSGINEFDTNKYIELDLNKLTTPIVGEIKIIIYNYWDSTIVDNLTGSPGSEGTYLRINKFFFGGNSTYSGKYYNFYDGANSIDNSGNININNYSLTSKEKFIAVDLGRRYSLDILKNYTKNSKNLWSITGLQASNSEVDNPEQVIWGNSGLSDTRWILFSETTTTGTNLKYLDILRVYPDITSHPKDFINKPEWVYLNNVFTDNNISTYITQIDYPIIAIKLENQFKISNFKIEDTTKQEYSKSSRPFYGWTDNCFLTISSDITDNPSNVMWNLWKNYSEENKEQGAIKWFSFKNNIFDLQGGGENQYIANFIASTEGKDLTDIGQTNDRVDFTEYSKWFNINPIVNNNIAKLTKDIELSKNLLYGSSTTALGTDSSNVFDENNLTSVVLQKVPANIWRCFGDITYIESGSSNIYTYSGSNGLITLSGTKNQSINTTYIETIVNGIELIVESGSRGIPNTIQIQTLSGTDPTQDSSWSTIFTETDLALEVDELNQPIFNGGIPYSYRFFPTLESKGIRLNITDSIFSNPNSKLTEISEFKILQEDTLGRTVTISNDYTNKIGGSKSVKITCSGIDPIKITVGSSFNLAPDPLWSIQDYISFYFKTDNFENIDFSNSKLRLGNTKNKYYEWSLLDINNINFNLIKLKFLNAITKGEGDLNINNPNRDDTNSVVDFSTSIEFLELEFKLNTNTITNIWLDNFNIIREDFNILIHNNTSTYLNNKELLFFPINGFDAKQGYFEINIAPDWSNDSFRFHTDYEAYTLFTIYNGPGEGIVGFYSLDRGFAITINTIEENYTIIFGKITTIEQYKPFKLAMAWDSTKNIDGSNATLKVWINDTEIGFYTKTWSFLNTGTSCFYLGSIAPSSDVSIDTYFDYGTITSNKLLPKISSLTGAISNFMLSLNSKSIKFDEIDTLKDKLYISLDGVTFFSGIDNNLPLLVPSVPNLGEVIVWVKAYIPRKLDNIPRTGYMKARWKLI